jgi:hypothetical protein
MIILPRITEEYLGEEAAQMQEGVVIEKSPHNNRMHADADAV